MLLMSSNNRQSARSDAREEFPLRHFAAVEFDIAGQVFDQYLLFQNLLYCIDTLRNMIDNFVDVWQWQQVVQVMPAMPGPAKMVGNKQRLTA